MTLKKILFLLFLFISTFGNAQKEISYNAGFKTIHLIDSSRSYKPDTGQNDKLHYRPLDIDLWYPSQSKQSKRMLFEDLFRLHEQRANFYQDEEDYTGFSDELVLYLAAGFGLDAKDGKRLLKVKTDSYSEAFIANGEFPLVIYMAGYNGMGWENYRLLESLAENGFTVLSISSIGRYPGDMTNDILDTQEQVYDAEFALEFLKKDTTLNIDFSKIGILGLSWGGMSGIMLLDQHPEFKAMVSLDGTDNFYYGETDQDDAYLSEIYAADKIHPEKTSAAFLHLEAGDRHDEFSPTDEYRYIDKISSPKKYLRFSQGKHEDFASIAYALKSSEKSIGYYKEMIESTNLFFQKYLKGKSGFQNYYNKLLKKDHIEGTPYDYTKEKISRITLNGVILDKKEQSALSYVNIGLLNSEIGTVSDLEGEFEIQIPESKDADSLRFSMIGYKPLRLSVKDLMDHKDNLQINLEEAISSLEEVVLKAKTWKKKKLGNETKSNFIGHLFYYEQLGKEMGIKLKVNKKPNYVEAFSFHVSYNRFSAKSFFRLNIYDIVDGKPNQNILKDNIIISVEPKKTGMISTNLEAYNIVLTKDVFVSREWIDTEGEIKPTEALIISVGLFTGGVYERNSKEAKMRKRLKGMGLGFTMDVRY
jgi:hypothetical protein